MKLNLSPEESKIRDYLRPRQRYEDNIKTDLKWIVYEGMGWLDRLKWWEFMKTVINLRVA
jgi:hypothetical protein